MAGIVGVAGILVWTSPDRFPAMVRFYTDVLGLTPRSRRHEFVSFEWGDLRLTLAVHSQVEGASRDPDRIMINLATTDIEETAARLAAQGVEFVRPPERESWGGWIATFTDPDGNRLQLLQPDIAGPS